MRTPCTSRCVNRKWPGTKKIDKTTIVDYDKDGQLIGVEILFVRETNPNLLKEIQVENLVSA